MKNSTHGRSSFTRISLHVLLVVCFAAIAATANAQATVQTDQLDYPPGSTAVITGAGFQPNEEVELHVHHVGEDSLGTDPQNHEPWMVIADENGNFTTSWYVPSETEGDALGATLLLEAHGNLGSEAEWTFTDGNLQNVSVAAQVGTLTYGTGGTVNYPISVGSTGGSGTFNVTLSISGLPSGVTSNFPLTINGVTNSGTNATLILTVPTSVKASTSPYTFTVTATPNSGQQKTGDGTLTIGKKAITGSITVGNKVYDGNTSVAIATRTLTGVVGTDDVSYTGGAATFTNKNAGTGKTVNATGLSLTGTDIGNYTVNTTASTTADITTRSLTVSASGTNKSYDGTATASVTLSDNRVVGDGLTTPFSSASFSDKNVGTGKTVSVSGISISGTDAGNYSLSNTTATTTANITAKALTITAAGVNKVYDGTAAATVTLSDNRIAGDIFTSAYTTATFASKTIGTGKPVSVSGISISGTDAGNYTANTTASTTANITALGIAGSITVNNKVYDGTTTATIATRSLTGAISGDNVSYTGGTAAFINKNIGTGKTVNATGLGLTGSDAGNYTVNTTASTTADITARTLTITATATNKVYDGNATASVALSDNRVSLDVFTTTFSSASFVDNNVGTGKTVTVSGISISGTDAGNYNANASATTTANITKASLTVTADDKTKVYDGLVYSPFTVSYSGFAAGENESNLGGALTFSGSATTSTGFGNNLKIIPAGLTSGNYTIAFVQGLLDISRRPVTITADAKSKTYGNADPALTYQITSGSLVSGDAFTGTLSRIAGENVGTYSITQGTVALNNNYTLSYQGANLTINKATATLSWAPGTLSQIYDGSVKTVVAATTPSGLSVNYSFTGTPQNVGSYPVIATINDTNYQGSLPGTLVIISPATTTVVSSLLNPSVYGQSVTFTVTITSLGGTPDNATVSFYDGATLIGTTTSNSGTGSLATSSLTAGTHSITAQYAGAGIFNASTSASLSQLVNKADATVSVSGYTGVYDAATHGATGTASGVGGADLSSGLNLGASFTNAPGGTAFWAFTGGANYNDQSGTASIVINKADATVTVNGYAGTYDAASHGATGTATGVGGADLSAGLDLGASFTDVPGGTAHWTFAGGTNYNDQLGDASIVINKADADVTVNGYAGTYDALPHGATGSATGVGGADLSADLDLGASFTNVPGGTASWTFTGGTNYNDQSGDVAIVINKADAVVTVTGYTGVYDAASHGASGSAAGVAGDPLAAGSSLNFGASFTDVPGGTADWTFTGGTNYNDQSGTASIVINKADAVVTVNGYTGVYDAAAHGATGSVAGVTGDPTASGSSLSLGASFTDVPGGTASWTFTGGTNYNDQSGTAAIVINKADAVVTVTGYTGVYDAYSHGASGTATGVGGVDLSSGLSLGASFTNVPGGTANWTFEGGTNYLDESGSVAITINKADATLLVSGYTGVYDASAHGATGTATGVSSEPLAGLAFGASFTDVPGGTANWVFTDVTGNYNDASGSVAIVLTKANAVVTVNGYTGVYDASAHGATGSATGVGAVDLSAGLNLGASFTNAPGGTANWTFAGGTNYNNQSGSVAIVINKADALVTVIGYTGVYDAAAHGATGTATGVGGVNLIAGLNLGATFTNAPGGTANWTFTGGTNYNDQSGTAAIVITKANTTVSATGGTFNFDDNAHAVVAYAIGVGGVHITTPFTFSYVGTNCAGAYNSSTAPSAPGTYTATATFDGNVNYNGSSASASITIVSIMTATASGTNNVCNGGITGSATVVASLGKSPYTYLWSNGGTTSTITGLGVGTYNVTVTDANSCTATASYTVTQPSPVTAVFATNNNWLYFGYSGDQTATITVKPSGGLTPASGYKVTITMNRPVKCNYINDAGDEKWTATGASSTLNNTCPGNPGLQTLLPSSTWNSVAANATVSLNVTLMQDATFTVTVTDANNCVYTSSVLQGGNLNGRVDAEDVRCFAGNSGVAKVTMCHKTGSAKNPCVEICIDESAVADHLAHGDFYGKCNPSCTAPVANARLASTDEAESVIHEELSIDSYPNPFKGFVSVQVSNPENKQVAMQMVDVAGRSVLTKIAEPSADDMYKLDTENLQSGLYILRVTVGNYVKTMKLMKE